MNDDLINVQTLKPFTRFIYTIGELPTSYLMSMTYEEQLIWLCNYLAETVIPTVNNNGQAVTELQEKYIELKSYVDDYFNNLNVQEEIDNKLDRMAEDGTLQNLIQPYFNLMFENVNSELARMQTEISSISNGTPTPVSNVSDMTDTTKPYLLTTDGNWYYYDGTEWVSGGVYQATSIDPSNKVLDGHNIHMDRLPVNYGYNNLFNDIMMETGGIVYYNANTELSYRSQANRFRTPQANLYELPENTELINLDTTNLKYWIWAVDNESNLPIYSSGWKSNEKFTPPYYSGAKYAILWGAVSDYTLSIDYIRNTFVIGSGKASYFKKNTNIKSIAHQGYSTTSQPFGNSRISSFIGAKNHGFDYGETDLQWTSDEIPVCCHDTSFNSGGTTVVIADHTLEELKQYNYYGEKIASLEEVVSICKQIGLGLYIDKIAVWTTERWNTIFGIIKKYQMEDNVVWIQQWATTSLNNTILNWYPKAKITMIANANNIDACITSANALKTVNNEISIDLQYDSITLDQLKTAVSQLNPGVKLEVWTIDTTATYLQYLPYVSGITSNK